MIGSDLDYCELISAEPGHNIVFPKASAQPLGDRAEQPIADRVTERVVDALEVVEIET